MKGGPSMNKQTGAWHSPQTRRQPVYLPADVLDDDALYTRRTPSSVRRYATTFPTSVQPRTEIRFIRHQGPPPMQRASRLSARAADKTRPTEGTLAAALAEFRWTGHACYADACRHPLPPLALVAGRAGQLAVWLSADVPV